MSILTFPAAPRSRLRPPRSNPIGVALTSFVHEWRFWKASRAMQSLSDEMLHDIGVSRSDIDDATRHGRPARF